MMHFTTVALFLASLFLVTRALRSCGAPPCMCFRTGQVACPRLGPGHYNVPAFTRRQVENMTSLNLAGNDIREIRAGDFNPRHWRSLQVVDLRRNPNLDCTSLNNIPFRVNVLADCEVLEEPALPENEDPPLRDILPAEFQDALMSSRNELDSGPARKFHVRFEGTIEILD